MPNELTMQIAQVVPCTEAEGPGKRFAVWFQGCPLRCPGCCNPEFLPFKGGETKTAAEMSAWIRRTRDENGIEGITLLGGEPTSHATAAVALSRTARELGLSVMTFSGYTIEELHERPEPEIAELIGLTDILVDGPYLREQPDTARRWIGSTNQRIHFLTDRHSFDEQWRERNTLEIRVVGREVTVNGFPAADAVGLWKGWKRKKPLPVASSAPVAVELLPPTRRTTESCGDLPLKGGGQASTSPLEGEVAGPATPVQRVGGEGEPSPTALASRSRTHASQGTDPK